MINIVDKHNCCGCSACVQACPKQCITLCTDEEGFAYPIVNKNTCIDCGLCERVCPCLNQAETHKPVNVFAAKNPDEAVRLQSSSGGVFSMLAAQTIQEGGVVFGARFNDQWEVVHDYAEAKEELTVFRGSKYVQSRIGNTYQQAQEFLKDGRKVLFSGTPCQISGLKLFLRKEYDNLLTVECVCHGVPSPGLWQQYLIEQTRKDKQSVSSIGNINFRDKVTGWRNYSFSIEYKNGKQIHQPHDDNHWERAFIKNIDLRPSCHTCPAKCDFSKADFTLGDLWGTDTLMKEDNDNKGITLLIIHNKKGLNFTKGLLYLQNFGIEQVAMYNSALVSCPIETPQRILFFNKVQKSGFIKTVHDLTKDSFILRLKIAIARTVRLK